MPRQLLRVNLRLAPVAIAVEDALLARLAQTVTPIAASLVAQQRIVLAWSSAPSGNNKRPLGNLAAVANSAVFASAGRGFFSNANANAEGNSVAISPPGELMRVDRRIFIKRLSIGEL